MSQHRLRPGHQDVTSSITDCPDAKATLCHLPTHQDPDTMLLHIILSLALHLSTAAAACYYSNGTDVTKFNPANKSYQPCNVTAPASMCCRINLDPGTPQDHCRPDGLCDSPDNEYLWRESCSDPTWKSPHCQKLCLDYDGRSSTRYFFR